MCAMNPRLLRPRATRWTPTNLGAALALWLDASDDASITLNGSTVSQWNDKSGNARHVSQSTALNQPTRTASVLNGRPVLTFNGSSTHLRSANGALQLASLSAFVVARSLTQAKTLIGVSHAATTHTNPFARWVLFHQLTPSNALNIRIDGSDYNSASGAIDSDYSVFGLVTGDGEAFVNGVSVITATPATVTYPNSTPFLVGANAAGLEVLNGNIAEIAIVDEAVNLATRRKIEGYLAHKWGIAYRLDSSHPYKNLAP